MAPGRRIVNDFRRIYRRALAAEQAVRVAYKRELPEGENVTLDSLGASLEALRDFLEKMGVLIAAGLRPMAAPPPDPEAASRNLQLITEPLSTARAKYRLARHIISNLDGLDCTLPIETVRNLGTAIEQANALAERL